MKAQNAIPRKNRYKSRSRGNTYVTLSINIPIDLSKWIMKKAEQELCTKSVIVRQILQKEYEQENS
jgi:hypothetical protein